MLTMLLNLLYTFLAIADSAVLVIWGLLDLKKFRISDAATRSYRRDGLFLVALGVCGFGMWGIGHFTEKSLETEIAAANDRAAEANARARSAEAQVASANAASRDAVAKFTDANARIAEANAKAAQASEEAEQERLARIKIEERMTPRGLQAEQEDRIIAKLSVLKGCQADFAVTGQTWEQVLFMRELEQLFRRAQWSVFENQAEATGPWGAMTKGILARPLGDESSLTAAFKVRDALLAESIRAHVSTPSVPAPPSGPARVLIIVGEKP